MKRLAFIVGSAIIGVVGNWVRVYLTMMIEHLTNNRFLRDDHYTFGWLLFAVFLFLFCWLGWRYRDSERSENGIFRVDRDSVGVNSGSSSNVGVARLFAVSVVILATLMVWPLLESWMSVSQKLSKIEVATISPINGWTRVEKPSVEWAPEITNPSQIRIQAFEKDGQRVDVFLGVYRDESWDSKLVTVSNQLAGTGKSDATLADRGIALTEISGFPVEVKTGIILGRTGRILAWHWYWIDGVSTGNDLHAKFQQLLIRLQGVRASSVWVAIYTEAKVSSDAPSKLLQVFMHEMGTSLESALVQNANR